MSNIEHLEDIEEIVELLRKCDDAYFNSEDHLISDREYDVLKRRAFLMEPSNEYFTKIGSDVRGGKIKLPYAMGSLNQVYENEIGDWVSKYDLAKSDVFITHKLNGVSCLLVYNNGNFSIAYSRGNGIEGADVTRHVKSISSVPKKVDADYLVVRAEIIMRDDVFAAKHSSDYKNPLNMVAGIMNRKENPEAILKDLDLIAYEIVDMRSDAGDVNSLTKTRSLELLTDFGFTPVTGYSAPASVLSDPYLTVALSMARTSSKYDLDGLVITVDNLNALEKMSKSSSLNPEHSVKYKVLDASAVVETFVKDVHWEVSKSGYLKPRVEILPVELFGTTVKFATGFNAKFIKDNNIGPNAKVKITKAGQVIPYIISVTSAVAPKLPGDEFGEWEFNETGVEAVLKDKEADAIIFKQVLDFFETYKIDMLREASLSKVWAWLVPQNYDDAVCDICDLTESEWNKIIGENGSRIYKSIRNRLNNSAPETFYGATRYMGTGFGVRKAKALLEGVTDIYEDVKNLTLEDIVAKDGFDVKTATMVVSGIPQTLNLMDRLCDMGVLDFVQTQKTDELKSVNVVMTGFRDPELQATIESMGGKVSSGVSKKTTHLLCMDTSSTTTKMQKAREMGVEVMTPDEFKMDYGL